MIAIRRAKKQLSKFIQLSMTFMLNFFCIILWVSKKNLFSKKNKGNKLQLLVSAVSNV